LPLETRREWPSVRSSLAVLRKEPTISLASVNASSKLLEVAVRKAKLDSMGDKSPKAKDKAKKQDKADKGQKQAKSDAKKPVSAVPKGK
jgi:hypothetical protein